MSRILYITQIEIDFGAVRTLAAECATHGIRRPLIVGFGPLLLGHRAG